MLSFLIYDLKVAALLVVFYMFYRLLLERTSLVHFNRVVLLLTAVLSFVLPLCIITVHEYVEAIPVTATTVETAGNEILQQAPVSFWSEYGPRLTLLLTVVLVGGMLIRMGIVVRSFLNLKKLISNSEKQTLADGVVMAITDEPVAPFSWMRTVVMNRSDYASQMDGGAILAHERGHIRCHHSLDVVLVEVLTALQWFNPVVWFLRQDLRALHECEADQAVLSQGFNTDQYIQLLIRKAIGLPVSQLANGMSARTIKKRIVMMKTNRKPSRSSWLRALYILPIVALALIVQAHTVVECRQPSLATEGVSNDSLLVAIDGGACYTSLDELPKIVKPEDIGSITVVKGKAAADVFGEERAKDGVVVIETKAFKRQLEQTPPDTVVFNGERDALASAYAIHLKDLKQVGDVLKGKVASAPELDYEGGFNAFLANNLKYPVDALKYGVTDKMTIAFRVNEDGTTTLPHLVTGSIKGEAEYTGAVVYGYKNPNMQKPNAEQQKAAEAALFEEVQRVLKKAPKWKPARNGEGEPMAVTVSFPVIFQLK
jgi:beta-lactamase regulating signal transducer with metallopeptidase domain